MRGTRTFAGMEPRSRSLTRLSATSATNEREQSESDSGAGSRPRSMPLGFPSAEQGSAIDSLSSCDDTEVLAWLTVLRSIKPSHQHDQTNGAVRRLSPQQLDALSCLSPASDEKIKDWLMLSRRWTGHALNGQLSPCSSLADCRTSSTPSSDDKVLALYETETCMDDDREDLFQEPEIYALQKGILKLNKPLPPHPLVDRTRKSTTSCQVVSIKKNGHPHWSTRRDKSRQYDTCDGFRRQENEREMHYVFMPNGPIEESSSGQRCALCHVKKFDEEHLRYHNVWQFTISSKAAVKKSRKGDFIKLLKTHKVPDTMINRLVIEWYVVRKKKAYSCGLCVKFIPSLSKRTSHMCQDHFGRGQNMEDWDDNNLIRGLLLQPKLRDACCTLFGLDPSCPDWTFVWPASVMKDLQHKLEMRQDTPRNLALIAFNAAERVRNHTAAQDVTVADSQFRPHSQRSPRASHSVPHRVVANTSPATNETLTSTSATPLSDTYQEPIQDESAFGYLYDLHHPDDQRNQFHSHENGNVQRHMGNRTYVPDAMFNDGHLEPSPFQSVPVTPMDIMDSHTPENVSMENEHALYTPPPFSLSPFADVGIEPGFGFPTADIPAPEYDPSQDPNIDHGSYDHPPFAPLPKRKLSEFSTLIANSRPQTLSPWTSSLGPEEREEKQPRES